MMNIFDISPLRPPLFFVNWENSRDFTSARFDVAAVVPTAKPAARYEGWNAGMQAPPGPEKLAKILDFGEVEAVFHKIWSNL